MKHASLLLAAGLLGAPLASAQDTVWRCTEADGKPHYTNIKKDTERKHCQVVTREVSVVGASGVAGVKPAAVAAAQTATPASFPRVDRDTQRQRDEARRKILSDELSTEEKSLADARSKLTEQEGIRNGDERNYQRVLDRLKPFQETVDRHERNVAALRKELANLK